MANKDKQLAFFKKQFEQNNIFSDILIKYTALNNEKIIYDYIKEDCLYFKIKDINRLFDNLIDINKYDIIEKILSISRASSYLSDNILAKIRLNRDIKQLMKMNESNKMCIIFKDNFVNSNIWRLPNFYISDFYKYIELYNLTKNNKSEKIKDVVLYEFYSCLANLEKYKNYNDGKLIYEEYILMRDNCGKIFFNELIEKFEEKKEKFIEEKYTSNAFFIKLLDINLIKWLKQMQIECEQKEIYIKQFLDIFNTKTYDEKINIIKGNIDSSILYELSKTEDPLLKIEIAKHKNADMITFKNLYKDENVNVRLAVAEYSKLSYSMFEELASSGNQEIIQALCNNETVIKEKYPEVLYEMIVNSDNKTLEYILNSSLSNKLNYFMIDEIFKRENISPTIINKTKEIIINKNIEITPNIIDYLYSHNDYLALNDIIKNTPLTNEIINKIIDLNNELLNSVLITNKHLDIDDILNIINNDKYSLESINYITKLPNSQKILNSISNGNSISAKISLAKEDFDKIKNSNQIIKNLLASNNIEVLSELAKNPTTPTHYLYQLSQRKEEEILIAFNQNINKDVIQIANPYITTDMLKDYLAMNNIKYNLEIALHPNCDKDIFKQLLEKDDIRINRRISRNKNIDSETFYKLLECKDLYIYINLYQNEAIEKNDELFFELIKNIDSLNINTKENMKDILITMQQYNEIDDSYTKSLENFLNESLENIIENYKNDNKEQNNIEDDLSL